MAGIEGVIDPKIKRLVELICSCPRWSTVASCEGHPHVDEGSDHAFITFELLEKHLCDYDFFHSLLGKGVNVSFGHENRVIISHPWRQYGEEPTDEEKVAMNSDFIRNAVRAFEDYLNLN